MQNPGRVGRNRGAGLAASARRPTPSASCRPVMTDFWLNHFSVYVKKNQYEPYLLNSYEREAILPNALGNFEQLLIATAKSPAMLMYLGQTGSPLGPRLAGGGARAAKAKKYLPKRPHSSQMAPRGASTKNYAREAHGTPHRRRERRLYAEGRHRGRQVLYRMGRSTVLTAPPTRRGGRRRAAGPSASTRPKHAAGARRWVMGRHDSRGGGIAGRADPCCICWPRTPRTAHFISQKNSPYGSSAGRASGGARRPHGGGRFTKTNGKHPGSALDDVSLAGSSGAPSVLSREGEDAAGVHGGPCAAGPLTPTSPTPGLLVQAVEQLGNARPTECRPPNGYSWQSADWGLDRRAGPTRMKLRPGAERRSRSRYDDPSGRICLGDAGKHLHCPPRPRRRLKKKLEYLILGEPASAHTRETVMKNFNDPETQKPGSEELRAGRRAPSPDGRPPWLADGSGR